MGTLPSSGPHSWSQVCQAHVLRLVLCLLLLGSLEGAPTQPACTEEEYFTGTECCPTCRPGYYVENDCSEHGGTVCRSCPEGTYTAHYNGLSRCLSCQGCEPDMGQETRTNCTSTQETTCKCSQGHFCLAQEGDHCALCQRHSICSPGQRVQRRGNHSQDTECAQCPPGTYSDGTLQQCLSWTRCTWLLQQEAEPGTSSTDVTCSLSWEGHCLVVLGLITALVPMIWIWKKRKRRAGHRAKVRVTTQGKTNDEGVALALPSPSAGPGATPVAVEDTAWVFQDNPDSDS